MRHYRKNPFKMKLKKDTVYTIAAFILMAGATVVGLSFTKQGDFLIRIYNTLAIYFSWGAIFLPVVLFLGGLLLTKLRWKIASFNVFVGLFLIWLASIGLFRAGMIGEQIWSNIEVLITGVGAILVLICAILIGFTILINASLGDVTDFTGEIFKKFLGIFKKQSNNKMVINQNKAGMQIKGEENNKEPRQEKIIFPQTMPATTEGISLSGAIENTIGTATAVWEYPSLELLDESLGGKADRGDVHRNADIIEKTLGSFGVEARVAEVNLGPAVTQYALEIASGMKLSKIMALQNDLALALAAPRGQVRVEAPIPGRSLVGIEVPNNLPEFVTARRILASSAMTKAKSKLAVSLGLDVSNSELVADIAKMPHVLIAGATGSGKSVCINAFLISLLYRCSPQELRLILIDPKRVELTPYNGIPHLLAPVVVEMEKVLSSLKWILRAMEERYKKFAEAGTRNIEGYNEQMGYQALPYIVVFIDELADIMMFSPAEVEDAICRIAQMARATGIHLVVSTQRPSVDVITGLIKANIPCRIAFNVTSMMDSRVILDTPGAEKLLGRGDMLYIPPDQSKPTRIQGAFVSDKEVQRVVAFLKSQKIEPQYVEEVTTMTNVKIGSGGLLQNVAQGDDRDPLFSESVRVVCSYDKASSSLLQRRLSIGYARAARILDQMEVAGIVGPGEGSKPRDVLIRDPEMALNQANGVNVLGS